MNYYFAPMEGLTGYIYRNAHNTYFNHIDQYFSPFISANQGGSFKDREMKDILPENNLGLVLIPQVLTNKAKDFILTSKRIKHFGYNEVNLNLGCPFRTVVSKNKGSGFLAKPKELDMFLEEVFFEGITEISVKTRLGKLQGEEFYELIEIFNKYPIKELSIHPRIQTDFYKNKPNMKIFKDALSLSKNPICYNGDIYTVEDYKVFVENFPEVTSVMLGRGLLANPSLTREIQNQPKMEKKLLKEFHDRLYSDYKQVLFGDMTVLFKMKGLWFYMASVFSENEKYLKKIKKSLRLYEYEEAVSSFFREQELLENYEKNLVFKVRE